MSPDRLNAFGMAIRLAMKTREKYGVKAQRDKCLEEMDELNDAISDEHGPDAIIDECADVIIMCASVASTTAMIGNGEWVDKLMRRIDFKVCRQHERMNQDKRIKNENG